MSVGSLVLAVAALVSTLIFGPANAPAGVVMASLIASAPALILALVVTWRGRAAVVGLLLAAAGLIPLLILLADALIAAGRMSGASPQQVALSTLLATATAGTWTLLFLPFAVLLLVFPDGRFLARAWRRVAASLAAVVVAFCLLGATQPVWTGFGTVVREGASVAAVVLLGAFLVLLAACAAGTVVRYRSAVGPARLQLRWLALAGAGLPLFVLLGWASMLLFGANDSFDIVLLAVYVAIPVTVAIAVLRYDLYDVDRLLVATAVYTVLLAGVVAVVAATSAIAGMLAAGTSTVAMVAVTAVTTLALGPTRRWAQRWLRRWLFPASERARRALAQLLTHVQSGHARPEEVEHVLRMAVGDPGLRIAFRVPDGDELVTAGGEPTSPAGNATEVRVADRLIGVLIPGSPRAADRHRRRRGAVDRDGQAANGSGRRAGRDRRQS